MKFKNDAVEYIAELDFILSLASLRKIMALNYPKDSTRILLNYNETYSFQVFQDFSILVNPQSSYSRPRLNFVFTFQEYYNYSYNG